MNKITDLAKKCPKALTLLFYFAVLFSVYGWFLNNPFIMDDEIHIVTNRHIQDLSHWPSYFTSSSMDSGGAEKMEGIYYKPLLMTHFAVIWEFFGADPFAYRLPNYILHTFNAFLIFNISLLFLPFALSFMTGLLFLLHPVNAEAVLYICDMQDILYLFFGLSSLFLASRLKSKASLFIILTVVFWLGMLSKETAALFLLITPFYIWQNRRDKFVPVALAAGLVVIGYALLRYSINLTSATSHHLLFHQATYFERLPTLPMIWAHYFELLFFPWRLSLTTDYVVKDLTFTEFWLPIVVVLSFCAFLFVLYRQLAQAQQRRWYYFFLFVLLCWFGLHSHILVPLDGIYTDRWLYLTAWAFVSILVLWLSSFVSVKKTVVILSVLAAVFAARDYVRGQDWSSPLRLYSRELQLHPFDAVMSNNVGVILFREGQWRESKPYFIKATEINPTWNVAWNNWGAVEEQDGQSEKALELYKKSFTVGGYALAVENYAKLLCRMNRIEECREQVRWALERYPHNSLLLDLSSQLQRIKQ